MSNIIQFPLNKKTESEVRINRMVIMLERMNAVSKTRFPEPVHLDDFADFRKDSYFQHEESD